MKTFIIELDNLEHAKKDSRRKLMGYITSNKFEFWEYVSHQTMILTPDSCSASNLMRTIKDIYGDKVLIAVFEVSINDMAGYGPQGFMEFFTIIKHPEFIPAWERGDYDPGYMAMILDKAGKQ
jgi:hypothetical protein